MRLRMGALSVLIPVLIGAACRDSERTVKLEKQIERLEKRVAKLEALHLTDEAKTTRCHASQRMLEAAIDIYMGTATDSMRVAPVTPEDLVPRFLDEVPICPGGGVYTIEADGERRHGEVHCSIREHARPYG